MPCALAEVLPQPETHMPLAEFTVSILQSSDAKGGGGAGGCLQLLLQDSSILLTHKGTIMAREVT